MRWTVAFALFGLAACRTRAPEPPPIEPSAAPLPAEDAAAVPTAVPKRLVLGLLPIFGPEEMKNAFAPLAAYLSEELGVPIDLKSSEDYRSMVELVVKGEIDLVELAPLAYVMAKSRAPDLDLLATNIAEGSSTYSGYIVARADSSIQSAQDFRGKRFGFVDVDSSSGFLYPYAFLLEAGIQPERDLKKVLMTRRHDLGIEALLRGEIDATATFSGALLNAASRGLAVDKLRIVAKTGRIPYDAWCARRALDPALRAKIRSALLRLSTRTGAGRKVLDPLRPMNAFAPATDAMYDEVRRMKAMVDAARAPS